MKVYVVFVRERSVVNIGGVYITYEKAKKEAIETQDSFGLSVDNSVQIIEREVIGE